MKIPEHFLYVFLPVALLLFGEFFWYITPFADIALLGGVIMTCVSSLLIISELLRRRWIAAWFRLIPIISIFSIIAITRAQGALPSLGFYAYTLLNPASIGACGQASGASHRGQERIALCYTIPLFVGNGSVWIIHDGSDELSLPYEARDKDWRMAAGRLPGGRVIADFPHPATKLFDSFYAVVISLQDADRS